MLNITLTILAVALTLISALIIHKARIYRRNSLNSLRPRDYTQWMERAFKEWAQPQGPFGLPTKMISGYGVCDLAARVCQEHGTTMLEQTELLKAVQAFVFYDGRGGSNCTHFLAMAQLRHKNPVIADFLMRLMPGVNFYLDNNLHWLLKRKKAASERLCRILVATTLGHEYRHTEQSWEFINQGRPGLMMQFLLINPITIILTLGWSFRKYNNIPSENDANKAGLAFAKSVGLL